MSRATSKAETPPCETPLCPPHAAFLFLTKKDRDRDGHGPDFRAHMKRINDAAGTSITVYHSFHEEVELHQGHWWKCSVRSSACTSVCRAYVCLVGRSS